MRQLLVSILLAILASQALAEKELRSLENLSEELVKIRQDISQLHDQISFEKSRYNDQVRAFANQKSDLEVKNSRAELNIKELERELDKLREENQQKRAAFDEATPVLETAIASLRESVVKSLPFKLQDRLEALHDIEHRLKTNLIRNYRTANAQPEVEVYHRDRHT